MHSEEQCEVKCNAIQKLLTNIQQLAGVENNYAIRHQAESALDLIKELKGEFNVKD
jgi:hypothetical protein